MVHVGSFSLCVDFADTMGAISGTVRSVVDSKWDVQMIHGLLQPLLGLLHAICWML